MNRTRLATAVVIAALTLHVRGAHAQTPPPATAKTEVDRAVTLALEGRTLYDNGRFAEALEKFRAADRIAHSPVLSLYVARCERNLNHLVAARDAYRIVALHALAPGDPPVFASAKSEAATELGTLEPRIPRVKVEVPVATAATRVQLDGVVVETAEPLWVDPGDHELSRHDGGEPRKVSFRAVQGAATLTIELPAPGAALAPAGEEPMEEGGLDPDLVPGLAVLGLGVAALGVGTVTGVVTLGKASELDEKCKDGHCPRSEEAAGDSATTFATVSTVSFIVAGVATAAGVVLLVTLGGDDEEEAAKRGPRIEVAPTGGGAVGTLVF